MLIKSNLNRRICDCENCENTQTYREFIIESEDYLGMDSADLDNMNDKELSNYLDFVDCLWGK